MRAPLPETSRVHALLLAALVLLPLLSPLEADAQRNASEESAVEGALFLLLPVGAQGVALGRAMTALSGADAAFWNPAGLTDLPERHFVVYRGDHLAGEATAFSLLLRPWDIGSVGVSYQLLDSGEQEVRGQDGTVQGSITVRSHLGVLSYATRPFDRIAFGTNVKAIRFRVGCRGQCQDAEVTATTWAVDVGVQTVPFQEIPLRVGALVAHLGPRFGIVDADQADPLPTRIRLSGAYQVLEHLVPRPDLNLWLALEVEDRWRSPGDPSVYLGSQFSAGTEDVVYLRAGYVAGGLDQRDGAAVGVGLEYDRFDMGLARSLAASSLTGETEPVHITLGIRF